MEGLGQPMAGPVRHLYVHVPFCHKICPYCSFYKHLPSQGGLSTFGGAILEEARLLRQSGIPLALETVYFGGGTPTLLSTAALTELLPSLADLLDFRSVTEWTMEVNPRTITPEKAAVMRSAGVSRVSLGVQAWDEPTLATLGRDHSPGEAEEAFNILRGAGFAVVNVDLMFSVPGQSLPVWRETLERTIALRPDHVSAYNLTYEEDTEFFEKCQAGGEFGVAEDRDEACFAAAMDLLEAAGLPQYEISNYGRPDLESRHNRSYWAGEDYASLGPGAVSTVHGRRRKSVMDTARWQQSVRAGAMLYAEDETISASQWLCERLALGLRTREGLPAAWLSGAAAAVARLREEGLLESGDSRLRLTRRGKFVADGVITHLWQGMDD